MSDSERDPRERIEELYQFLQGNLPDRIRVQDAAIPRLTADQAWTVIWYLGNLYWQIPDHIERCDECHTMFDTKNEGQLRDSKPFHLCDNCAIWDD